MPKPPIKFLVKHREAGFMVTGTIFSDHQDRACQFDSALDAAEAARQVFGPELDPTTIQFIAQPSKE